MAELQAKYIPPSSTGLSTSLMYGGGLIGIFNQQTELRLHTPYGAQLINYVKNSTYTVIQNILNDSLSNVINIDPVVADSIPSSTTSPKAYNGLLSNMVRCLAENSPRHYKIEIQSSNLNNTNIIQLIYVDVTDDENKRNDKDVLVIDGRNRKTYLVMEYYTILYEYMQFCLNSIKLANKPVFKLNELRVTNSNRLDRDIVKNQIEHTLHAMKRINGLGILDSKDTIELIQNDVGKYSVMQDIAYGGISAIMGVPRSYLDKDTSGALSTTGEGDRLTLERTLESTWEDFIKPIISRVYDIVGLDKNYIYKTYKYNNLIALAEILPALQDTTLIEDKYKTELIYSALGLESINNSDLNKKQRLKNG